MPKTTRPVALSTRGMVASPHYLASLAGLDMLRAGGSAVDAAIAVNACLGVVYPHMTGMGGDAFWLIHDGPGNELHALNGSGRAVQGATREFYRGRGYAAIPERGPLAALTVPGTVDSWCAAHARFGKLALADILAPAIRYAREGYPVSEGQVRLTRATAEALAQCPFAAEAFLPGGRTPRFGEILRFPRLAAVMETVARDGRAGFYEGAVAEEIVRSLNEAGSFWTYEDLAGHRASWERPISTPYRDVTCYQHPPNSQGFAHLMMLNLLEGFDIAGLREHEADYVHLIVEATKLAFAERDRYLGDPAFTDIPLDRLLSKEYAAGLAGRIGREAAPPREPALTGQDTTCTVVVDADGNAVSMIQSLYHEFGAAVAAGETGLLMQNRGAFFSLDKDHVNRLEPGKRCFHTLMPGMLFREGRPFLVYGTMGGEGQPQTGAALVTRIVDFGMDPQSAIDAPRWLYGRTWGEATRNLRLESRFGERAAAALAARRHQIEMAAACPVSSLQASTIST
jgi:gamma-glutamyltranspeptidase/glutathione hydrolase